MTVAYSWMPPSSPPPLFVPDTAAAEKLAASLAFEPTRSPTKPPTKTLEVPAVPVTAPLLQHATICPGLVTSAASAPALCAPVVRTFASTMPSRRTVPVTVSNRPALPVVEMVSLEMVRPLPSKMPA